MVNQIPSTSGGDSVGAQPGISSINSETFTTVRNQQPGDLYGGIMGSMSKGRLFIWQGTLFIWIASGVDVNCNNVARFAYL